MAKKLLLFLLIASCTSTNDVLPIEAESNTQTTTTEVFVKVVVSVFDSASIGKASFVDVHEAIRRKRRSFLATDKSS